MEAHPDNQGVERIGNVRDTALRCHLAQLVVVQVLQLFRILVLGETLGGLLYHGEIHRLDKRALVVFDVEAEQRFLCACQAAVQEFKLLVVCHWSSHLYARHLPSVLVQHLLHDVVELRVLGVFRCVAASLLGGGVVVEDDLVTAALVRCVVFAEVRAEGFQLAAVLHEHRVQNLQCGCVGSGAASEFRSWCKIFSRLPSIDDIFRGRCDIIPTGTDALYALVSSMTAHAREHKDDITAISYSIDYALRLPSDFSFVLMKNYMAIEDGYKNKLLRIPAFSRWLSTKGKLLNGTR